MTLTRPQCIDNSTRGIELLVNSRLQNSTTFHLLNNESFIVGCRRCNINKAAPNWFYSNHTIIPGCNNISEICTQTIGTIKYLEILSFHESLVGEYKCTRKGRIYVELGQLFWGLLSFYVSVQRDSFANPLPTIREKLDQA